MDQIKEAKIRENNERKLMENEDKVRRRLIVLYVLFFIGATCIIGSCIFFQKGHRRIAVFSNIVIENPDITLAQVALETKE